MDHPRRKKPARAGEVEAWLEGVSERIVEKVQREGRESSRRRHWLVGAGLAAAAIVLLILSLLPKQTHTDLPGGPPLGPQGIRLLRPLGETRAFDVFEWEGQPPVGGSAEIRLGPRGHQDEELMRVPVSGSSWRPTPDQAAKLPDDIWWEVRYLDRLGATVDRQP